MWEFKLRVRLKGEVVGFYLEKAHFVAHFLETRKRDLVLGQPWVVAGQVLAIEP